MLTCSHHDIAENYSFGVKQQSLTHSLHTGSHNLILEKTERKETDIGSSV
jgi:hypothetical protein